MQKNDYLFDRSGILVMKTPRKMISLLQMMLFCALLFFQIFCFSFAFSSLKFKAKHSLIDRKSREEKKPLPVLSLTFRERQHIYIHQSIGASCHNLYSIFTCICIRRRTKKERARRQNLCKSFPFIFSQGLGVSLETRFGNTYFKPLFFSFFPCLGLESKTTKNKYILKQRNK